MKTNLLSLEKNFSRITYEPGETTKTLLRNTINGRANCKQGPVIDRKINLSNCTKHPRILEEQELNGRNICLLDPGRMVANVNERKISLQKALLYPIEIKERQRSLPAPVEHIKADVSTRQTSLPNSLNNSNMVAKETSKLIVDKLNNLMFDLETSFTSLTLNTAHIGDPIYESLDSKEDIVPYVLDDYNKFISRKNFSRSLPLKRTRISSDSKLSSLETDNFNCKMLYIDHHSTLCRRLKTLEASYGITLKKQLHFYMKNKMRAMNVAGCTYCMFSFYVSSHMLLSYVCGLCSYIRKKYFM